MKKQAIQRIAKIKKSITLWEKIGIELSVHEVKMRRLIGRAYKEGMKEGRRKEREKRDKDIKG